MAPIDAAFSKFYEEHKISEEAMEEVREQHISPYFMPTRRLMHLPKVPVLLSPP